MKSTIAHITVPKGRRVIIISDIHGHADEFTRLLHQVSFSADDVLILVGDYIEKGVQSLETVRYIMKLSETHTVFASMGNVDMWRIWAFHNRSRKMQQELLDFSFPAKKWWGGSMLEEALKEMDIPLTPDMDIGKVLPDVRKHLKKEFDFLKSLPTVMDTGSYYFVHGGIKPEYMSDPTVLDRPDILKFDNFYAQGYAFPRYVVVGHWPVTLNCTTWLNANPLIDRERHIICIDGGCGVKREGQLNALILPSIDSEEFFYASVDSLPHVRALDAQAGRDPTYRIIWSDRWITPLENLGDYTRVFYHGKEILVPSSHVRKDERGDDVSDDISDAVLEVHPGDELSLIMTLGNRAYVKKDGLYGWYEGRTEQI